MQDRPGTSDDDQPQRALPEAMARALEAMLRRRGSGTDRLVLLRSLRSQMNQALAEAPLTPAGVEKIAARARLAAIFDAECTRLEAVETASRHT